MTIDILEQVVTLPCSIITTLVNQTTTNKQTMVGVPLAANSFEVAASTPRLPLVTSAVLPANE